MADLLKEKYLDKKYEFLPWNTVVNASITALSGISDRDGTYLADALNIQTIRDLAENKFVRIAQMIVSLALIEELEG